MARDSLRSWLGGRLGEIFGSRESAEAQAPEAQAPGDDRPGRVALEELARSLDLLRGEREAARLQETDEQRKARLRAEHEEAERLEADQHRREMLEDILALHRRLETGIDQAELDRLRSRAQEWLEEARRSMAAGDLSGRALGAVAAGIYRTVGEHAWSELRRRMAEHGVPWPDPVGVPPHSDSEDRERARTLQEAREQADFVATRAPVALARAAGVVEVWRAAYPARNSPLWESTALRGVGCALRLRLFERAFEAGRARGPELRQGLASMLQTRLAEVKALLAEGVTSLDDADRIAHETERIVYEAAPAYVWEAVKDEVLPPQPVAS